MTPELIKETLEFGGMPVIRHIKTDGNYYIKEILDIKINGKWQHGVLYFGRTGRFVRAIDDFEGFEYVINETGLKG